MHLWAIEDIWSVLVEDDGLPVQVARTGHRQEGQEEDHDGQGAPGLARQLCRIRTGAGAQDWLVRLAGWCAAPTKAAWAVLGGLVGACLAVRGRIHRRLPAFAQPISNVSPKPQI